MEMEEGGEKERTGKDLGKRNAISAVWGQILMDGEKPKGKYLDVAMPQLAVYLGLWMKL